MSVARAVKAYVELARVSNLPTCASNVLVGAAIGAATRGDPVTWWPTVPMVVAIALLYAGGMALNDLLDLEVDRAERPGRPLPSGRIGPEGAMRFIWVTCTLGLGTIATIGVAPFIAGLVLVAAIVSYNATHRRGGWSVLLMGACRALVYLTTALAFAWPLDWTLAGPLAAGLGAYVAALSVVAAIETRAAPGRRGAMSLTLPLAAGAPLLFLGPAAEPATLAAAAILLAWLAAATLNLRRRPPRIGAAVAGWIAGIALVDALYLTALQRPALALVAGGCFLVTVVGHRLVRGT
jgi:4-hydroxybenzoate polyprenyltransferase